MNPLISFIAIFMCRFIVSQPHNASQPNLMTHSVVSPFPRPECHHQIASTKFNLKIYLHHHILKRFGIVKMKIRTLSDVLLQNFIGKGPFSL